MDYKSGLRVKHPVVPDWGVGEVLEDSSGHTVKVFFVGGGEKTLSLKDLQLVEVFGEEAKHPILDNLKISTDDQLKYRSLPESIRRFLIEYPGGFYGEKFARHERDYKLNAHQLTKDLMSKEQLKSLLDKEDYNEICRRALKVINSTNLVFPNEKMSLKDGLVSGEQKRQFATVLENQLFGDAPLATRFDETCEFLQEIGAAKWTLASYFLFFMFPDRHMFIKPTITKNAADICHFDVHYRADLNWQTYNAVLRFAEFLRDALRDLKPRDMIDVQSFMWCIRPDKTLKSFGKKKTTKTNFDEAKDA